MNNLHRELAPISEPAWQDLGAEIARTFKRHSAARRVVDVAEPGGPALAAVSTGRLTTAPDPAAGVVAQLHDARPLVRLRVPFTLSRTEIDAVERGAADPDWAPAKDAARQLALGEDRIVFDGYPAAAVAGIRGGAALDLPQDLRTLPATVSRALTELRLAGVAGPYALLLSAEVYTAVGGANENGDPVLGHLRRLIDGDIVWAPAIDGALVLSTRGGDFDLRLGTDVAVGYTGHDAESVQLYLEESLTFLRHTPEAAVTIGGPA